MFIFSMVNYNGVATLYIYLFNQFGVSLLKMTLNLREFKMFKFLNWTQTLL